MFNKQAVKTGMLIGFLLNISIVFSQGPQSAANPVDKSHESIEDDSAKLKKRSATKTASSSAAINLMLSPMYSEKNNGWLNKGYHYDSLGNFRKSIECYTYVLKTDMYNATALVNRSVAYVEIGKNSLALVDLNKLIRFDNSISNAFINRYALHREAGNYEFAMGDINRYIELEPGDLIAKLMRVELAVEMEYYDVAISDLKNVLAVNTGYSDLQIALAEVYAKANQLDSATQLLNKLALKPKVDEEELYLINALILSKSGQYKESNEKLNLVLLNKPDERGPLKLKADNLFFLKEYENALLLYKKLIRLDSSDHGLWADVGHCYLQLELYSEALEVLSKSVRKRNAQPAYAYLGRGIAHYNLKQYNKACGDWQKSSLLGNSKAKEYLKKYCVKEIKNE